MSKLIIDFTKPKTWNPISAAIKAINKTEFSHVCIRMNSASLERDLVYQATGSQVNFIGNKRFAEKAIVVESIELDVWEVHKKKILQFCVDNAGVGYGVKQLFGMLYVSMMRAFGKKVKNPFTNGMVCTEVVVLLLILLEIPIDAEPDTADLNDVHNALMTYVGVK